MRAHLALAVSLLALSAARAEAQQVPTEAVQPRVGAASSLALELGSDEIVAPDDRTADTPINNFRPGVITFLPRKPPEEIEALTAAKRANSPNARPESVLFTPPMMTIEAHMLASLPRLRFREVGYAKNGAIDLTVAVAGAGEDHFTPMDRRVGCFADCTLMESLEFEGRPFAYSMGLDLRGGWTGQVFVYAIMVVGDLPLMIDGLTLQLGDRALITLPDGKTISLSATARTATPAEFERTPSYTDNLVGKVALTSAQ